MHMECLKGKDFQCPGASVWSVAAGDVVDGWPWVSSFGIGFLSIPA